MKNFIVLASLMLASVAQANPQKLPSSEKVKDSFSPAIHRTYSVGINDLFLHNTKQFDLHFKGHITYFI